MPSASVASSTGSSSTPSTIGGTSGGAALQNVTLTADGDYTALTTTTRNFAAVTAGSAETITVQVTHAYITCIGITRACTSTEIT